MQDPITVAIRNTSKLLEGRVREKMIRAGKLLSSSATISPLKLSQSADVSNSSIIDELKEDVAQMLGTEISFFGTLLVQGLSKLKKYR